MKEGAAHIADALLPPEDGAVTRALSDLKAKLSTWSEAVASVQSSLAAQASKLAEMDSERRSAPESTARQSNSADGILHEADRRENVDGSDNHDAVAPVDESAASSREVQGDEYQTHARAKELLPAETTDDDSILSQSESVEQTHETPRHQAGEDQAMLESLDEKMAKAIRVQFRLFDGRKSIRELIDAYEEEPEEPQKSWWQRVKG